MLRGKITENVLDIQWAKIIISKGPSRFARRPSATRDKGPEQCLHLIQTGGIEDKGVLPMRTGHRVSSGAGAGPNAALEASTRRPPIAGRTGNVPVPGHPRLAGLTVPSWG